MLSDFLSELRSRNEFLYWFGWLNVLMLIIAVIMFFIDKTIITGINAWIKPMKFAISIVIYAWTFAWLLHYLPDPTKRNFISWGVIVCMMVENGLIFMQAARGVRSHFNVQAAFDGIIFSIMGIFIIINTLIIVYTIILFFIGKIELATPLLWAWRIGLIFFFLGGISGGLMSGLLTHTVGAADGGSGLPFINWSTVAGDIRSAHFITLHGLQIIPLATFFLMKFSQENAKSGVLLFSLAFLGICIWLHWLALRGIPLISD